MVSVDRIKGLSSGLAIKAPCRVATTANITLSGLFVVDTEMLASGDAVLVKNQTDPVDNGVWVASTSSWSRREDADGSNDLVNGTLFTVVGGAQSGQIFQLVATDPVLPGTTALTFAPKVVLNLGLTTGADLVGADDGASGSFWATVQGFINRILSASGAATVGFSPTGLGATDTTVQDALDEFNHLPTGQFFSDLGARVDRMADRAFFGDAVLHNGADSVPQADWLTQYELSRGRAGGSLMFATGGITNGDEVRASNTFVVGSQAKDLNAGYNAVAVRTLAANNSTLSTVHAYAGYFEAYRNIGANGGAYGLEIDNINYESVIQVDPYQQLSGQTIGLQIAAGGEFSPTGQLPNSAAINIRKNGSTYERGIVFGSDCLTGSNGFTGTAPAIVMGVGHQILWFGSAGQSTSQIVCVGTTYASGIEQRFVNDAVNFRNSNAKPVFQIGSGASYVNYISARGSATGNGVQISAQGDDANIDLQLIGKGAGLVNFGIYTSSVLTPTGYITIRDTGGTVRRLLVG